MTPAASSTQPSAAASRQGMCFVHWVFPAMLGVAALGVVLSGRSLAEVDLLAAVTRSPVMSLAQRSASLLLLGASGLRLLRHVLSGAPLPSPILAFAFALYWITTIALPAFYGTHKVLSHELLYPMILGSAVLVLTPEEARRVVDAARTSLVLFLVAGVAMIPINIGMVLDLSYSQGYIPGLPRFGGLAAHPVSMGMLALVTLMCLWGRPYQRKWLNRLAWLVGLGVLFMTQSKTAWIAFTACMLAVGVLRLGGRFWRRATDARHSLFGVFVCLLAILGVIGTTAVLLGTDVVGTVAAFLQSPEAAQLASLTGRDRIWAIAWEEWEASPFFGYGLSLWDDAFRASINMPNATHAHNQFLDTLARSGLVGTMGLVIYAAALLFLSIARAKATGGLSLALFFSLALLSISEVPLLLLGYGVDLFTHLLLVATLMGAAPARRRPQAVPSPAGFRTAS